MRVKTVRDHVLSIIGTDSQQCIKIAGKTDVKMKFQ